MAHPRTGAVEAVVATAARAEYVPLGAAGRRLIAELRRHAAALRLPESAIALASRSHDDALWVLRATADASPSVFYLVAPYARASGVPRLLLAARPRLRGLPLARAEAVTIPARDGQQLPAYLTLPPPAVHTGGGGGGGGARAPPPLVLLLHGGPSARDYAGYDPLVQMLAARAGVAVLQLNYRGSTGFGKRHLCLGNGNLPGMHADVEDARRWAVESGHADAARVGVVGASWGGYLSLGAATGIAPPADGGAGSDAASGAPRYAAVVAIVPVVAVGAANTSTMHRGDPLVARYWRQLCGAEVSTDKVAAAQLSPLHRLGRLQSPLMLVHGEQDPRVPRSHGDAVRDAARELGLSGVHLTYAREGHSIRRERNVLHLWSAVEIFLCQCLQLPPPPPPLECSVEGHTATLHWENGFPRIAAGM